MKKPKCKIVGTDGNVFCIIGLVSKTLKKAGQAEKAEEFRWKASECQSYSAVISLLSEYVDAY